MEVNLKSLQDAGANSGQYNPAGAGTAAAAGVAAAETVKQGIQAKSIEEKKPPAALQQLTLQQVTHVTEGLTKVMQSLNTDITFAVHKKTGRLMVQVMDSNRKVLKEFPSHELLDTIAAIGDYVGALLDKKV